MAYLGGRDNGCSRCRFFKVYSHLEHTPCFFSQTELEVGGQFTISTMATVVLTAKLIQREIYKIGVPKHIRSVTNVLDNTVNERFQPLGLVPSLSCIVFDRDRFRQGGKGCSAVT